jgi:hypothetical protein
VSYLPLGTSFPPSPLSGTDFDDNPPTNDHNDTIMLYTVTRIAYISAGSQSYVSTWLHAYVPTHAACREQVSTNQITSVIVQVSSQLCIRSARQRTIYLKVTALNVPLGQISATAIVWSS